MSLSLPALMSCAARVSLRRRMLADRDACQKECPSLLCILCICLHMTRGRTMPNPPCRGLELCPDNSRQRSVDLINNVVYEGTKSVRQIVPTLVLFAQIDRTRFGQAQVAVSLAAFRAPNLPRHP